VVSTMAGGVARGSEDGFGRAATFEGIYDLSAGPDGNIYVKDSFNVRKIGPSGQVST
jgi:hypothetical protein